MTKKLAGRVSNVTRRGVLSGAVGIIATSGAVLALPGEADHAFSLRQMASALHDAVGRYSAQNARRFVQPYLSSKDGVALMFSMECMRDCSVDEIQHFLKPLYEGQSRD